MRRRTFFTMLSGSALLVIGILSSGGCGVNRAQAPATIESAEQALDEIALPEAQSPGLDPREAELQKTAEDLETLAQELRERLADVESRESALADPVPPAHTAAEPPAARVVSELRDPIRPVIARQPRWVTVTVPATTRVEIRMDETVSSETHAAGRTVQALVARDVLWTGHVVIPAGSKVLGTVTEVTPQKRIAGQATLTVSFDRIETPAGAELPITAALDAVGKKQKKKDAVTIGGSAAGGAVLGRVLSGDKDKGTLLGAVLGAAIGTAVASTNKGDAAVIEVGTVAEVRLGSPVEVAVLEAPPATTIARN